VLAVVYAGAGASAAGAEEPYFTIPAKVVGALVRAVGGDVAGTGAASDWPSALTRVAELAPLGLWGIAQSIGVAAFLESEGNFRALQQRSPRPWAPVTVT